MLPLTAPSCPLPDGSLDSGRMLRCRPSVRPSVPSTWRPGSGRAWCLQCDVPVPQSPLGALSPGWEAVAGSALLLHRNSPGSNSSERSRPPLDTCPEAPAPAVLLPSHSPATPGTLTPPRISLAPPLRRGAATGKRSPRRLPGPPGERRWQSEAATPRSSISTDPGTLRPREVQGPPVT